MLILRTSIGSFLGIGAAKLGFPIMDPIASVVICLFILKVAYDIIRDSLRKMLDTSCSNDVEQQMQDFISAQDGVVQQFPHVKHVMIHVNPGVEAPV